MSQKWGQVHVVSYLRGIRFAFFSSRIRCRLRRDEHDRQFVLAVMVHKCFHADVLDELLRGLSVDFQAERVYSGLGGRLNRKFLQRSDNDVLSANGTVYLNLLISVL